MAIGSFRGTQAAVGGWAGKHANGRRYLCDPHRAAGSSRDANRSDTSPATLSAVVFKLPSLGGSIVIGRSSKSNQSVVLDCIIFAKNCTFGIWSTPRTVRFGPTCPMLGETWTASSDEIVHEWATEEGAKRFAQFVNTATAQNGWPASHVTSSSSFDVGTTPALTPSLALEA